MYVFDNAAAQASARLDALAQVFDPGTIRHLEARGVAAGWRCLEVGGGGGSITRWLAERVGTEGHVLALDLDPRHLASLASANVEVRPADIATAPLPPAAFDLAYARLVLEHLPDPSLALGRMAAAIKPGGWVVVEDFEVLPATADTGEATERISKAAAVMRRVVVAAGAKPTLGRSLPRLLRTAGLESVDSEGRVFLWRGGSAGAALSRLNFQQLREPMLATGEISPEELDRDLARLDDEDFEFRSPILWTAWGRAPA